MANPFTGAAATFSPLDLFAPDVSEGQRQLARRQAIADLLRQQALENDDSTKFAGGWAIPNSGFKPFEKLATALVAGKVQKDIDTKQSALAKRYAEALSGGTSSVAGAGATGATGAAGVPAPSMQQLLLMQAMGVPVPTSVAERLFGVGAKKEVIRVDNGDSTSVVAVDPYTGQPTVVQTTKKGVSPDTTATNEVRVSEGARDRALTERGQNMTASTAAAGQAITAAGQGSALNFGGTSMDAQAMNVYRTLSLKQQSGQPLSPAEQVNLDLAKRHLTEPRVVGTPEGGFTAVQPPPLPNIGAAPLAPPAPGPAIPGGAGIPPAPPAAVPAPPAAGGVPPLPPAAAPPVPAAPTGGGAPAAPAANAVPGITQITPPNRTPTPDQSKAAGFSARMLEAEKIIEKNGPAGQETFGTQAVSTVPLVGQTAQRLASSEAQQSSMQAQQDWVRAKLRKESQAVIGVQEMIDEIQMYFPQPGEPESVVKQKAEARKRAQAAMELEGGPAIAPLYKTLKISPDQTGPKTVKWGDL